MANMNEYIKKMIDKAQTRKMREDLAEGDYVALILGLTHERREKREKLGKAFWIDYKICEATQVGGNPPTSLNTDLDLPLVLEGQYSDMAFQDLKNFLIALTGCDDDKVAAYWDELVDVVSDEGKHSNPTQPARGMLVRITTRSHTAKSGKNIGKSRVYPRWHNIDTSSIDERNTKLEIAARRKELDAA